MDHEETEADSETQSSQSKEQKENYKWNAPLKKTLTNEEILSQSILFLAAGYETTTTVICFIVYQLALNPQYQQRLCEEIDQALDAAVN